jgi:hypothetical protein
MYVKNIGDCVLNITDLELSYIVLRERSIAFLLYEAMVSSDMVDCLF